MTRASFCLGFRTEMELARIDDEHNLIARYAARLAGVKNTSTNTPTKPTLTETSDLTGSMESFNSSNLDYRVHQDLIDELEASNRQIMEEIELLRKAKESSDSGTDLLMELQMLKQHRDDLEYRMSKLHDGRKDLMEQLEKLMAMLKTRDKYNITRGSSSPRSSPTHHHHLLNGAASPSHTLAYQQSISPSHGSPAAVSRTKQQFSELFDAADAINDALAQLVEQVTDEPSKS